METVQDTQEQQGKGEKEKENLYPQKQGERRI